MKHLGQVRSIASTARRKPHSEIRKKAADFALTVRQAANDPAKKVSGDAESHSYAGSSGRDRYCLLVRLCGCVRARARVCVCVCVCARACTRVFQLSLSLLDFVK